MPRVRPLGRRRVYCVATPPACRPQVSSVLPHAYALVARANVSRRACRMHGGRVRVPLLQQSDVACSHHTCFEVHLSCVCGI